MELINLRTAKWPRSKRDHAAGSVPRFFRAYCVEGRAQYHHPHHTGKVSWGLEVMRCTSMAYDQPHFTNPTLYLKAGFLENTLT